MPKPVLKTRQIGMQTHYSRHPLAPPEIVYACEEPEDTRRIKWLPKDWAHFFGGMIEPIIVGSVLGLVYLLIAKALGFG